MITVELMGGLGNHLFQLFSLISYSLNNNIEFYIKHKDVLYRGIPTTYFDNIFKQLNKYKKSINGPVYQYNEPCFEYKPLPLISDKSKNYMFFGYFQSYKYFQNNLDKILDLLKLNDIKDKYKNNYDYENIVSLHFRIGDYINLQAHHPVLSIDYYINSLDKLIKDTGKNNWDILYFYEESDKDMIDKNINILKKKYNKLNFISIDHKLDDWEQMICMSLCKHNIIANSTFSWWGAYLNENNNRVYYPDTWFGPAKGNIKLNDLFLDDWVKII